jgi:hypothetical protein
MALCVDGSAWGIREEVMGFVFQLRCEMEAEKQRALQELEEQMRLELQDLTEKHKQAISEIKKKQWVCIPLALI